MAKSGAMKGAGQMRLPPRALRQAVTYRTAISAVALTAVITSAFTAGAAAFLSAVAVIAVRTELTRDPGSQIVVAGPVTGDTVGQANRLVAEAIRGPRGSGDTTRLTATIGTSLQSGILRLTVPGRPDSRLETQIITLPSLAGHVRLITGTCDVTARAAEQKFIPACLTQAAARALHLAVGDRLVLRDTVSGALIRVRITGIFVPLRLTSRYWLLDPMGQAPVHLASGLETAGPLVTSQAAAGRDFAIRSAAWLAKPRFGQFGGTGIAAFGSQLADRLNSLQNSNVLATAVVTTSLPQEFNELATALVVARTELLAGLLTLLVVAGATLALAVRLLAQRRSAEAALLSARGASRLQLARRATVDAVLVAIPAGVIGPLVGVRLALLLLRTGLHPVGIVVPGLIPAAVVSAWLAALAVTAGSVAVITVPWLRRPPSPLRRRASQGRQRAIVAAVYSNADLAVVAVAAAAAWELVHSAGPVSGGLNGSLSADPILLVAPVLALVAGALLTLRLLPLAARLGDRVAARGRGLVLPVAAWQISRRALRQAGPTLVGVLAVAAAVMALAQRDSWHGSVQAQASFAVGADTRITMPPAAQVPIGQVPGITRAVGVTASTPAVRASINLPNGNLGTLLALNTSSAVTVIPRAAAGPSAAVLHRLATAVPDDGVELPARPAALRLTARLTGGYVAQPQLFVQLTDAAGIGYLLPVGAVPSDGRPHTLTATIAPGNRADYPLRVTGFALQFDSPVRSQPTQTLTLSAGLAVATPGSVAGTGVGLAPAGRSLVSATLQNPGSRAPTVRSAQGNNNGDIVVVFDQGTSNEFSPSVPTGISVSDSYVGLHSPLPAVVTKSFLAATGARLGQRLTAGVDGTTVLITPVQALAHLPTMTNGSPGVLIDQSALTDVLQAAGAQPENITEWWLKTSGHVVLSGLPPGTSTASLAGLTRSLLADPLSLASQQALLALAIAAVLLAIIGMLVSIATASERARDMALLDALGMPPRQVARLLGLEQGLTAVAPSAIGLLFGAVLSELIIPAVTLTPGAGKPVPPVAVQVPWLVAGVVALALAVLPTLAITVAVPRRSSGAARIRIEEEA
jgi:hypothetical protein